MYYFKKMIETIQKQGGAYKVRALTDVESEKIYIDPILSPQIPHMLKECQVFVFSPHGGEPMVLDSDLVDQYVGASIDAPFKTFSVEILNGNISVSRPGETQANVKCLMVHEIGINQYIVVSLIENDGEPWVFIDLAFYVEPQADHKGIVVLSAKNGKQLPYTSHAYFLDMISELLKRLTIEAAGSEKVSERLNVRVAGNKEVVKIKRIIHITPKHEKKLYTVTTKRDIEWSHRWFSRGHWRKIDESALGKDREGNYCVVGRTWVSESIKGPDDKDIINKVRITK